MNNAVEQFRDSIQGAGLVPPDSIEADGKFHRFSSSGKRGDDAGWYVYHGDEVPFGAFGCWRSDVKEHWRANIGRKLSPAEEIAHSERVAERKRLDDEELARRAADAALKAEEMWNTAERANPEHPYLVSKGVAPHGIREKDGSLVVPMRDVAGVMRSLQTISAGGEKKFLFGGQVKACYFGIGKPNGRLLICEGFATGASLYESTGDAVAVAFNCGNLEPVATALRAKYPDLKLVICADDDAWTKGNPGITDATKAARAVGALVAIPDFGADRPEGATDFNDLAILIGREAVRDSVNAAREPKPTLVSVPSVHVEPEKPADGWPEPLQIATTFDAIPYPVEILPGVVGNAVREVVDFVQCPPALAACSALAVVSIAAQGLIDVRRDSRLSGPVSLFFMAIAESGERKSSVDGCFAAPLQEWEKATRVRMEPELAHARADLDAWKAKRKAAERNIEEAAKAGKPTKQHEDHLQDLEANKPPEVRVPRLRYENITPESLTSRLATDWPSGGVLSSEAGIVFGSHGMKSESVMENLALLNKLWDGGTVTVDRKTTDSFVVDNARLTMGLAAQPDTVRQFFERTRGLARSSGFAARFLIAWPASTQGQRMFKAAPDAWPHLTAFHRRIVELLDAMPPMEDGGLSCVPLDLSPAAKSAWIQFHDDIERELRSGGEMVDVRDVASKSADNAARLAALFHVLEAGPVGVVTEEEMVIAAKIVTWHLYEARRFLGELAMPQSQLHAARLDEWLQAECRLGGTFALARRDIQRNVTPTALREGKRLDEALRELTDLGRIRVVDEGKKRLVMVNPSLLGDLNVAS